MPMSAKKILFLVALIIVLGTVVIFYLVGRESGLSLYFKAGEKVSYTYKLSSKIGYGINDNSDILDIILAGILNIKVIEVSDVAKLVVSFIPEEVKYDINPDISDILSTPFILVVGKTGAYNEFIFPDSLDEKGREILKSIMYPLETIIDAKKLKGYVEKSRDGLGLYTAYYRFQDGVLHKSKTRYYKTSSDKETKPDVRILESDYIIVTDHDGLWLKSLSSSEHLLIDMSSLMSIDSITEVILQKSDNAELISDTWRISNETDVREFAVVNKMKSTMPERKSNKVKASLVSGDHSFDLLDYLQNQDANKVNIDILAEMLLNDESLIEDVLEIVRNDTLKEKKISRLITALSIAGTVEAQDALINIADDMSFSEANRFRSVMAFHNMVVPPIDKALNFLVRGIDKIGEQGMETTIANTSVLVTGALANNLATEYPNVSESIISRLKEELQNTSEPTKERILLAAIGNTRDIESIELVGEYLNDSDYGLRIASAESLGLIGGDKAKTMLIEKLKDEEIPQVQTKIIKSFSRVSIDSDDIKDIGDVLIGSLNPSLRNSSIKLLLENKNTAPNVVDKIFREAYKSEMHKDNKNLLLKGFLQ
ncbi:MAG: hypothetical protein C0603_04765 [Denitrovibrio sp.]|nr:MAG: hypothetical protein C0603_04765 [Denitrovibrio sp.]